ncbi:phosphatidylethanolamine-binding protein [Roridomyces roridus]|uniref:Phosphatidylethanolamine-binding protein n=1 Tax=Roridomyces roridus TaxID=1738132 RepID=A0AAD7C520_9AGAR|nr:phosphatidylethanolamine-binding protein [Roridomyces roridus]
MIFPGKAGDARGVSQPYNNKGFAQNPSASDVAAAFSGAGIVPAVVPKFAPSGILDAVFTVSDSQQMVNATPGTNLTGQQTASLPKFFFKSDSTISSDVEYVVAFVDPDAPTPQNQSLGQVRHFLGGGFHADATSGLLTNNTPALSEYFKPGPPAGSDPHRYTILLYTQSKDFATKGPSLVNASTPITSFNISAFADAVGLGEPIAGTFFFEGPSESAVEPAKGSAGRSEAVDRVAVLAFMLAVLLVQ